MQGIGAAEGSIWDLPMNRFGVEQQKLQRGILKGGPR
jgi:hypothetical protein